MVRYAGELGPQKADLTIGADDNRRFTPGYEYSYELVNAPTGYNLQVNKAGRKVGMVGIDNTYLDSRQEGYLHDFVRELNQKDIGPTDTLLDMMDRMLKMLVYPRPGKWSTIDGISYALQSAFVDVDRKCTGGNPLFNDLFAITIEVAGLVLVDLISERARTDEPAVAVRKGFESTRGKGRNQAPVGAFEMIYDDIAREFLVKAKKDYKGIVDETSSTILYKIGQKLGKEAKELFAQMKREGLTKQEIAERFSDLEFVSTFANDVLKPSGLGIQVAHTVDSHKKSGAPAKPTSEAADTEKANLQEARGAQKQRDAKSAGPARGGKPSSSSGSA